MRSPRPDIIYDPVCGMKVNLRIADLKAEYQGRSYWFCAEPCRRKFLADPEAYIKPKGWWRRYLDRLGRINQKQFGAKTPRCCS